MASRSATVPVLYRPLTWEIPRERRLPLMCSVLTMLTVHPPRLPTGHPTTRRYGPTIQLRLDR